MRRLDWVSAHPSSSSRYSQIQGLGIESSSLILESRDDGDQGVETIAEEEVGGLIRSVWAPSMIEQLTRYMNVCFRRKHSANA
jgi:hypothetical protein